MRKTNIIYLVQFVFISLFNSSCGKECTKERNELDPIDKSALLPTGTYSSNSTNDTMPKLTFVNDTLAEMSYKRGDKTYRLTYKIDTFGTLKINKKEIYE